MKLEIIEVAVVVIADQHNPSILHPAFLQAEKIVDDSWELAEPPLCTPPASVIKYVNGISFLAHTNRLQVTQEMGDGDLSKSSVPDLMVRYIEKLPHVQYTAVGINITGIVDVPEPEKMLIDKFLRTGWWNDSKQKPSAIGIRLIYDADGDAMRISLDPGSAKLVSDKTEIKGVLAKGNFHSELHEANRIAEAKKNIERFAERFGRYCEFISHVFELGE